MNEKKINILFIEVEKNHADLISQSFKHLEKRMRVTFTRNLHEARASISGSMPDLIITDYILPDGKGTELLNNNKECPTYPIVIMTSHGDEEIAVKAIKAGAFDYIVKSVEVMNDMPNISKRILHEWSHINKHKKAEQELRESEEGFRRIFEQEFAGIAHVDLNGQFLKANKRFCEITGYTGQELSGLTFKDITHPEDICLQGKTLKRVIDGEDTNYRIEKRYVRKNGTIVWVNLSVTLIRKPCGEPKYFVSVIEDITERRKLDQHISKLSHAVEQSSSVILITDTNGDIEYANPKFTQLTGYSLEEAIGKNPRMLQSGKTPPEVYVKLWKTILSGNEWQGEFCNKKKNNELYWENASISPVKDDKGIIINFIAVKEDITARKLYEEQIKGINRLNKELLGFGKLEEKLKRITDDIVKLFNADFARVWLTKSGDRCDSGCVHADTKNKEHLCTQRNVCLHLASSSGRYTHVDGKMHSRVPFGCYKIGRIAAGEVPKYLSNDIIHDQFIHDKEWAENLGLISFAGYKLVSAANKTVGVMAVFSKNFISSDTDNLLESLADTTAHVIQSAKTEMALLQSEKLKSLGKIAAGVSHEFNNILAVIMGSAEVLLEDYNDERELKKGLNSIIDASSDGAEIVKMMLTFANAEIKTSEYRFFNLNRLIKQAIDFTMPRWKNMAQSEGINYRLETGDVVQVPQIYCNPIEMREVLINLINNAMDAMPDGGRISISTKSDKNYIFLSVSDTGVGMSEDLKQKIFDPFYTTRRPHGTGLGLSVSYSIIKRHGGKIEVKSELGKGATFMLSIPVRKEATQETIPLGPDLKPRVKKKMKTREKGLRVLVVDDKEDICTILDGFLSRQGHVVKTVNNGAEAIMLSKKEYFDLVICDLAMDNVTGYDVIKAINKLDNRPKIGITTGRINKLKYIHEEDDLKVDFTMKKPFNLSELARHIDALGI
ncbi:MAG: PAS domain S-box protein [Planctomycetota bacterium]|jgi:PAS domain S-box-containing protein